MKVKHAKLVAWVKRMAAMCQPAEIVWIDGSEAEKKRIEAEAISTGSLPPRSPLFMWQYFSLKNR